MRIEQKPVQEYSIEQVCALLDRAAAMGFSLDAGCELEKLTIQELAELVTPKGDA